MKIIVLHLIILSNIFFTCHAMDSDFDTSAPEELVNSIQAKLENLDKSQLHLLNEANRLVPGPTPENQAYISSGQERFEQLSFFSTIGWSSLGFSSAKQELIALNQTEMMREITIKWLLKHFASHGISIDSFRDTKNRTALHIASALLYDQVVRILLDPRLVQDAYAFLVVQDEDGNTAAHHLSNFDAKALTNNAPLVLNAQKCGPPAARICIYFHECAKDKLNEFYSIRNAKGKTALDDPQ